MKKIDIILDTDFGADCDDSIALAMLINLAKKKKVNFDTLTLCTTREFAPKAVQAIFDYYQYQTKIGQMSQPGIKVDENDNYCYGFKNVSLRGEIEDATKLLRSKLANSKNKVRIVAIGPLTNMARLLNSQADDISPLNGVDLVKEKVEFISVMGCSFKKDFAEWNTVSDITSAKEFYSLCPVPLKIVTSELGEQVLSGALLQKQIDNPVTKMMNLFKEHANNHDQVFIRESWDEMTLLTAIGYEELVSKNKGQIVIDNNGCSSLTHNHELHEVYDFKDENSKNKVCHYINELSICQKESHMKKNIFSKKQHEIEKRKDAKIRAILFPSDIDKESEGDNYIILKNINKIYDNDVQAVFDFNLKIKKHEFVVFVGPSGCGKSTTLRMIAGLEEITSGDLFIDGVYTNELAPKNRNIAMVFQTYALYPHMTVYNNLAFGIKIRKFPTVLLDKEGNPVKWIDQNKIKSLKTQIKDCDKIQVICEKEIEKLKQVNEDQDAIDVANDRINFYNKQIELAKTKKAQLEKDLEVAETTEVNKIVMRHLPKREIDNRVMEAAKILEITEYLQRKPKALSGGQRQRVALGRAIVRNAAAFLMDEPLSNLDAKLRVQMRSEIVRLHQRIGATTIYVTHDQTEAMTMADRIVVMKDGMVQHIGVPSEIYSHPRNLFVAQFIGSPVMNVITGKYDNEKFVMGDFTYNLKGSKDTIVKYYDSEIERLNNVVDNLNKLIKDKHHIRHEIFVEAKERALALLDEYQNKKDTLNFDILLGIRPEDIVLTTNKIDNSFEVKADMVELLGSEYFVHVSLFDTPIVVKTGNDHVIKMGDTLYLSFKEQKVHLFDANTKMAIE